MSPAIWIPVAIAVDVAAIIFTFWHWRRARWAAVKRRGWYNIRIFDWTLRRRVEDVRRRDEAVRDLEVRLRVHDEASRPLNRLAIESRLAGEILAALRPGIRRPPSTAGLL